MLYNETMNLYKEKTTKENQSAVGLNLAKHALSLLSGKAEDEIKIEKDAFGKPYDTDGTAFFNISHSHEYAVCAVSQTPVGVDIEYIQPFKKGVMNRFFTQNEIKYINEGTDTSEQNIRFFEIWTLKEAYTKAIGKGLALLPEIEIFINNGCITANNKFSYILDYSIDGYIIAICY